MLFLVGFILFICLIGFIIIKTTGATGQTANYLDPDSFDSLFFKQEKPVNKKSMRSKRKKKKSSYTYFTCDDDLETLIPEPHECHPDNFYNPSSPWYIDNDS